MSFFQAKRLADCGVICFMAHLSSMVLNVAKIKFVCHAGLLRFNLVASPAAFRLAVRLKQWKGCVAQAKPRLC